MRIDSFQPARLIEQRELRQAQATGAVGGLGGGSAVPASETGGFGEVLGQELGRVNELLGQADHQAQRVATGDAQNLHESMLAMAEADLALQVSMRVTQKAIAAYQEISRMQI
ncbi:MAG: flagellar hook-basal body complex protein FliE [Armatimonadota bacterium]